MTMKTLLTTLALLACAGGGYSQTLTNPIADTNLPPGYAIVTDGREFTITDESGWRSFFRFKTASEATRHAWNWYGLMENHKKHPWVPWVGPTNSPLKPLYLETSFGIMNTDAIAWTRMMTNSIVNWKDHLAAWKTNGVLSNVVQHLVVEGEVCKLYGHKWTYPWGIVQDTKRRVCSLCSKLETQNLEWK